MPRSYNGLIKDVTLLAQFKTSEIIKRQHVDAIIEALSIVVQDRLAEGRWAKIPGLGDLRLREYGGQGVKHCKVDFYPSATVKANLELT